MMDKFTNQVVREWCFGKCEHYIECSLEGFKRLETSPTTQSGEIVNGVEETISTIAGSCTTPTGKFKQWEVTNVYR
jgi:hypothetical protein